MLFHIFGHVKADQGLLAAKEGGGQSPAQLGFAHPGGPQEQKPPHRPVGLLQPHPPTADGGGHSGHRPLLPHHPAVELPLQLQQAFGLPLGNGLQGDARPLGQHRRDLLPAQLMGGPALLAGLLPVQLPAEIRLRVPEDGRPLKVLHGDGLGFFSGRPLRPVGQRPEGDGDLLFHPHPGRPLVDEVDGLIRQEAVGEIALAQLHRRVDGGVGDGQAVVLLIAAAQPPQDGLGLIRGGLRHLHRLEAALQGRVLLDIFAVFLQGGGPHHLDLPPAQGRFENVGRVDGPLGRPSPHDVVELVQKQDYIARPAHLGQHLVHPLLKLSPVLGARHHGHQVQAQQALAPQRLGHRPGGHPQGQPLRHGGLAHPRFADEGGVVLGPPGQNLDDPPHLLLPAHQGVQRPQRRHPGQVPGKAVGEAGLRALPGPGPLVLVQSLGVAPRPARRILRLLAPLVPIHHKKTPQSLKNTQPLHAITPIVPEENLVTWQGWEILAEIIPPAPVKFHVAIFAECGTIEPGSKHIICWRCMLHGS